MIPILIDGDMNPAIAEDPRLSQSQIEAALKAAHADPDAGIVGLDGRLRPIVTCRLRGRRTQYALLRNGAPVEPGKIRERWTPSGPRWQPKAGRS